MTSLSVLLTPDFWKGIGFALFRTFVAAVFPFLLAYSAGVPILPLAVVSQVALVLIITVLTSFKGLPEPGPNATFWEILGSRFIRQFTQFMIAGIGTILLVENVPWWTLLAGAFASAAATAMQASLIVIPGVNVTSPPAVVVAPAGTFVITNNSAAPMVEVVEDYAPERVASTDEEEPQT